jgi:hypothetical protein
MTPGPWEADLRRDQVRTKDGDWVADCSERDIHAITAVPDLLAALKALLKWSTNEYQSNPDIDQQAMDAIAKAENRPAEQARRRVR